MVRWIRCPLSPDTGSGPVLWADGVFCKTVETGERSLNSSVSDSSTNHCAMSPALCECQCGDYDSGLVHQHKPEGRRLTSAIISTPLWSEWPLCIFSHEFIINNFLQPQRSYNVKLRKPKVRVWDYSHFVSSRPITAWVWECLFHIHQNNYTKT